MCVRLLCDHSSYRDFVSAERPSVIDIDEPAVKGNDVAVQALLVNAGCGYDSFSTLSRLLKDLILFLRRDKPTAFELRPSYFQSEIKTLDSNSSTSTVNQLLQSDESGH